MAEKASEGEGKGDDGEDVEERGRRQEGKRREEGKEHEENEATKRIRMDKRMSDNLRDDKSKELEEDEKNGRGKSK